jgi:LmbE family N-acetylglucosaminyl deacetylase
MPQTGPDRKLAILAVVAHPHDITHMSGTLANHVERGDSVTAVAMTGGHRTHREKLYDELRKPPEERDMDIVLQSETAYGEQKSHEMVGVCALFGITDVRIMPFPDVPFEASAEAIETLIEILYELRPHLVLTHAPMAKLRHSVGYLQHDDHTQTGMAVVNAMERATVPDAESNRAPVAVAGVYYTGVDFFTQEGDLFVDISDHAAKRMKAEALFDSQGQTPEFARKRVQIGAGHCGWFAHTAYAEGWVRQGPEVSRYLTITDDDLEQAEMSREALHARVAIIESGED